MQRAALSVALIFELKLNLKASSAGELAPISTGHLGLIKEA